MVAVNCFFSRALSNVLCWHDYFWAFPLILSLFSNTRYYFSLAMPGFQLLCIQMVFYYLLFFLQVIKLLLRKTWTSCSRWWTLWTRKQIQKDQELKEIETKKSDTVVQFVHPQTQAQRSRIQKRKHFRCSNVLALSSKMPALRSCQTNYIKHTGTKFHMVERYFPNQFLQIKKKELTDLGITHWIPNTAKTSHHKAWENLQWIRRWSTDSQL